MLAVLLATGFAAPVPLNAQMLSEQARAAPEPAGPRLSIEELRKRHGLPESRFTTIAGVPVHYTDQGRGPVIVLLHGSYLDLTSWDDWVAEFGKDHRVIRLDRVRFGLTGTFADRPPDYVAEQIVLDGLIDQLKLDRFTLVGSSSGGVVAAQYADRHPDKVSRLVLMNFPLGHGRIQAMGPSANPSPRRVQAPADRIDDLLRYNLADHEVITPTLVARLADFSYREDPSGAIASAFGKASSFTESDRAEMLGRIRQPTLVIWSDRNRTLPVAEGEAAFAAIGARTKYFTVVQNAGHMVPLEAGRETAVLARRFMAGRKLPARLARQK